LVRRSFLLHRKAKKERWAKKFLAHFLTGVRVLIQKRGKHKYICK
jgi:hypothetical protein